MAGPHSDPYPTGDPNRDEDQLDLEALKALKLIKEGHSQLEVSATLGIPRRTLQRRLDRLILAQLDLDFLKFVEHERLLALTLRIHQELEAAQTPQDIDRFLNRAIQLAGRRVQLIKELVGESGPGDTGDDLDKIPAALRGAMQLAEERARRMEADAHERRDDVG